MKPARSRKSPPTVAAVIAAAGQSSRMNGINKIFSTVAGRPLIAHTIEAFERCEDITHIILSVHENDLETAVRLCEQQNYKKVTGVVRGGATRSETVLTALLELPANSEIAAVHDGARPCVTCRLISETVKKALETGAAAPFIPVTDTLKETTDGITIDFTPDRSRFVQIQTPQCFNPGLLKAALTNCIVNNIPVTDDCAAVEKLGMKVWLVPGDAENNKVTTRADLSYAQMILEERNENWSRL